MLFQYRIQRFCSKSLGLLIFTLLLCVFTLNSNVKCKVLFEELTINNLPEITIRPLIHNSENIMELTIQIPYVKTITLNNPSQTIRVATYIPRSISSIANLDAITSPTLTIVSNTQVLLTQFVSTNTESAYQNSIVTFSFAITSSIDVSDQVQHFLLYCLIPLKPIDTSRLIHHLPKITKGDESWINQLKLTIENVGQRTYSQNIDLTFPTSIISKNPLYEMHISIDNQNISSSKFYMIIKQELMNNISPSTDFIQFLSTYSFNSEVMFKNCLICQTSLSSARQALADGDFLTINNQDRNRLCYSDDAYSTPIAVKFFSDEEIRLDMVGLSIIQNSILGYDYLVQCFINSSTDIIRVAGSDVTNQQTLVNAYIGDSTETITSQRTMTMGDIYTQNTFSMYHGRNKASQYVTNEKDDGTFFSQFQLLFPNLVDIYNRALTQKERYILPDNADSVDYNPFFQIKLNVKLPSSDNAMKFYPESEVIPGKLFSYLDDQFHANIHQGEFYCTYPSEKINNIHIQADWIESTKTQVFTLTYIFDTAFDKMINDDPLNHKVSFESLLTSTTAAKDIYLHCKIKPNKLYRPSQFTKDTSADIEFVVLDGDQSTLSPASTSPASIIPIYRYPITIVDPFDNIKNAALLISEVVDVFFSDYTSTSPFNRLYPSPGEVLHNQMINFQLIQPSLALDPSFESILFHKDFLKSRLPSLSTSFLDGTPHVIPVGRVYINLGSYLQENGNLDLISDELIPDQAISDLPAPDDLATKYFAGYIYAKKDTVGVYNKLRRDQSISSSGWYFTFSPIRLLHLHQIDPYSLPEDFVLEQLQKYQQQQYQESYGEDNHSRTGSTTHSGVNYQKHTLPLLYTSSFHIVFYQDCLETYSSSTVLPVIDKLIDDIKFNPNTIDYYQQSFKYQNLQYAKLLYTSVHSSLQKYLQHFNLYSDNDSISKLKKSNIKTIIPFQTPGNVEISHQGVLYIDNYSSWEVSGICYTGEIKIHLYFQSEFFSSQNWSGTSIPSSPFEVVKITKVRFVNPQTETEYEYQGSEYGLQSSHDLHRGFIGSGIILTLYKSSQLEATQGLVDNSDMGDMDTASLQSCRYKVIFDFFHRPTNLSSILYTITQIRTFPLEPTNEYIISKYSGGSFQPKMPKESLVHEASIRTDIIPTGISISTLDYETRDSLSLRNDTPVNVAIFLPYLPMVDLLLKNNYIYVNLDTLGLSYNSDDPIMVISPRFKDFNPDLLLSDQMIQLKQSHDTYFVGDPTYDITLPLDQDLVDILDQGLCHFDGQQNTWNKFNRQYSDDDDDNETNNSNQYNTNLEIGKKFKKIMYNTTNHSPLATSTRGTRWIKLPLSSSSLDPLVVVLYNFRINAISTQSKASDGLRSTSMFLSNQLFVPYHTLQTYMSNPSLFSTVNFSINGKNSENFTPSNPLPRLMPVQVVLAITLRLDYPRILFESIEVELPEFHYMIGKSSSISIEAISLTSKHVFWSCSEIVNPSVSGSFYFYNLDRQDNPHVLFILSRSNFSNCFGEVVNSLGDFPILRITINNVYTKSLTPVGEHHIHLKASSNTIFGVEMQQSQEYSSLLSNKSTSPLYHPVSIPTTMWNALEHDFNLDITTITYRPPRTGETIFVNPESGEDISHRQVPPPYLGLTNLQISFTLPMGRLSDDFVLQITLPPGVVSPFSQISSRNMYTTNDITPSSILFPYRDSLWGNIPQYSSHIMQELHGIDYYFTSYPITLQNKDYSLHYVQSTFFETEYEDTLGYQKLHDSLLSTPTNPTTSDSTPTVVTQDRENILIRFLPTMLTPNLLTTERYYFQLGPFYINSKYRSSLQANITILSHKLIEYSLLGRRPSVFRKRLPVEANPPSYVSSTISLSLPPSIISTFTSTIKYHPGTSLMLNNIRVNLYGYHNVILDTNDSLVITFPDSYYQNGTIENTQQFQQPRKMFQRTTSPSEHHCRFVFGRYENTLCSCWITVIETVKTDEYQHEYYHEIYNLNFQFNSLEKPILMNTYEINNDNKVVDVNIPEVYHTYEAIEGDFDHNLNTSDTIYNPNSPPSFFCSDVYFLESTEEIGVSNHVEIVSPSIIDPVSQSSILNPEGRPGNASISRLSPSHPLLFPIITSSQIAFTSHVEFELKPGYITPSLNKHYSTDSVRDLQIFKQEIYYKPNKNIKYDQFQLITFFKPSYRFLSSKSFTSKTMCRYTYTIFHQPPVPLKAADIPVSITSLDGTIPDDPTLTTLSEYSAFTSVDIDPNRLNDTTMTLRFDDISSPASTFTLEYYQELKVYITCSFIGFPLYGPLVPLEKADVFDVTKTIFQGIVRNDGRDDGISSGDISSSVVNFIATTSLEISYPIIPAINNLLIFFDPNIENTPSVVTYKLVPYGFTAFEHKISLVLPPGTGFRITVQNHCKIYHIDTENPHIGPTLINSVAASSIELNIPVTNQNAEPSINPSSTTIKIVFTFKYPIKYNDEIQIQCEGITTPVVSYESFHYDSMYHHEDNLNPFIPIGFAASNGESIIEVEAIENGITMSGTRSDAIMSAIENYSDDFTTKMITLNPVQGHFNVFISAVDNVLLQQGGMISFSLPSQVLIINDNNLKCDILGRKGRMDEDYFNDDSITPDEVYPTTVRFSNFNSIDDDTPASTQMDRHRFFIEFDKSVSDEITKSLYGYQVLCTGATPEYFEFISDSSFYIEIYGKKLEDNDGSGGSDGSDGSNGSDSSEDDDDNTLLSRYNSIRATSSATIKSTRAPIFADEILIKHESPNSGTRGNLTITFDTITSSIQPNDVLEIAFPYGYQYYFKEKEYQTNNSTKSTESTEGKEHHGDNSSKCYLSKREYIPDSDEYSDILIDETLYFVSFSATSLISSTVTAASAANIVGSIATTPPHIVMLRFTATHQQSINLENIIISKSSTIHLTCTNVKNPIINKITSTSVSLSTSVLALTSVSDQQDLSNNYNSNHINNKDNTDNTDINLLDSFIQNNSTGEVEYKMMVSLYRSLVKDVTIGPKESPQQVVDVDTLTVRRAYTDEIILPSLESQEFVKVHFYSQLPVYDVTSMIVAEYEFIDTITLPSSLPFVTLSSQLPSNWRFQEKSQCILSIGSPYFQDATITGKLVKNMIHSAIINDEGRQSIMQDIQQVNQLSHHVRAYTLQDTLDSFSFTFSPPSPQLVATMKLYLFCTDVFMPINTSPVTISSNRPALIAPFLSQKDISRYTQLQSRSRLHPHAIKLQSLQTQSSQEYRSMPIISSLISLDIPSSDPSVRKFFTYLSSTTAIYPLIESNTIPLATDTIFMEHQFITYDLLNQSKVEIWLDILRTLLHLRGDYTIQIHSHKQLPYKTNDDVSKEDKNKTEDILYEQFVTISIVPPHPWFDLGRIYEDIQQTLSPLQSAYPLGKYTYTFKKFTISSHCLNSNLDQHETDIDCGGGSNGSGNNDVLSCGLCFVGSQCLNDNDCMSNICESNICIDITSKTKKSKFDTK